MGAQIFVKTAYVYDAHHEIAFPFTACPQTPPKPAPLLPHQFRNQECLCIDDCSSVSGWAPAQLRSFKEDDAEEEESEKNEPDYEAAVSRNKTEFRRHKQSTIRVEEAEEEDQEEEGVLFLTANNHHGNKPQDPPSPQTLMAALKACANRKDLHTGSRIHADIVRMGLLERSLILGNTLVSMYGKCGALEKAMEVFDQLPVRDVVSWNVLIAGYVQYGCAEQALNCFKQMQLEGISPDVFTLACILKACGCIGAVDKGQKVHAMIVKEGLLGKDVIVGTALVDMYAKCGLLAKAQEVFDRLPLRNVVSWNALLAGYAQHGHGEQTLKCYKQMKLEGFSPNVVTFVCILKACGSMGAAGKGQEIHADILKRGWLKKNIVIGNVLVDMYAKCGLLEKAQEVFDMLPVRDMILWSVLIAGYTRQGCGEQAIDCFEQMQLEGLSPDAFIFACVLKACGSIGVLDKGQGVHAEVVRKGLLEKNAVVGTALVDMYAKSGLLVEAQEVFDELQIRDAVSWSVLIAGYAQHGCVEEALIEFENMQLEGISPDAFTITCILKACGSIRATGKGQTLHAEIVKEALLEKDVVIGTALVDMYTKCGLLTKAQEVFDTLPVQDVVSWNTLITGYAQYGHGEQALDCYQKMMLKGISPDVVTFACTLNVCGSIGAAEAGQQIHAEIARKGLLNENIVVGCALVDMYAKCGLLEKAQEVFDRLPVHNVVLWSTLIAGYARHGHDEEALMSFERMQVEGFSPDVVIFACTLKACGNLGAADKGREIHAEIVRKGLLEKDIVAGNALVDMYAKCGLVVLAQEVFDKLLFRDGVSWNALIAGYGLLGNAERVLFLFGKMLEEGQRPDSVTFTSVLNACSNTGLVDKGQVYFETMTTNYGIMPALEHYSCVVDLFSRAGHLDKAVAMIKEMPYSASLNMWHTLLGACQKWGNVSLGRLAFEHAVQLDEKDAAAYICMSNIYADAGKQVDAEKIDALRVKKQAWKQPGNCWWTDANGVVHLFSAGDKKHHQSNIIDVKLDHLASRMAQEGCSSSMHWVSEGMHYGKKEDPCGLCEKMAIACALVNTPEGTPIHVVKDMPICGDCHPAISLISKIEKRTILLKDANRFHVFEGGNCVCGEL